MAIFWKAKDSRATNPELTQLLAIAAAAKRRVIGGPVKERSPKRKDAMLNFVDESGPVTLAAGRVIIDVVRNGEAVGTIQWSDIGGKYLLTGHGGHFDLDDLAQITGVMMNMEHYESEALKL